MAFGEDTLGRIVHRYKIITQIAENQTTTQTEATKRQTLEREAFRGIYSEAE